MPKTFPPIFMTLEKGSFSVYMKSAKALSQIERGISGNVGKASRVASRVPYNTLSFFEDPTESEIEKSRSNEANLNTIRREINRSESVLQQKMDELWDIYNTKVKPLVSQSSNVNLNKYKTLENKWVTAIQEGKKGSVNVKIDYENDGLRPISFEIKYVIDGAIKKVKLSTSR
ncbi:DNA/RNA non-specific endonuclease [Guptibacillus hwajinpoensis]|uniref:DNA/RNA non-specific endonuclease n=1 Tax=Guptibacillus hwajinpoensis TaxID=208199 RepID=UPI001CFC86F7